VVRVHIKRLLMLRSNVALTEQLLLLSVAAFAPFSAALTVKNRTKTAATAVLCYCVLHECCLLHSTFSYNCYRTARTVYTRLSCSTHCSYYYALHCPIPSVGVKRRVGHNHDQQSG
jgi:hypothetical protein